MDEMLPGLNWDRATDLRCPCCGEVGPHTVLGVDGDQMAVQCDSGTGCSAVFTLPGAPR